MRRNRGVVYSPKECLFCGEEYVPTSGRQKACPSEPCQKALEKEYRSRQGDRYREANPRPTETQCEWDGCDEIFPVSWTGVIPRFCPEHRKAHVAPRAQAAVAKWRQKTIGVPCRYRECKNLQHPSGRGWCHYHYPILSMHGLSADGWWRFYDEQNGLCPICSTPLFDGRVVAVDHDHSEAPTARHDVEHVRGLLHASPCNGMIVGGIETAIRNNWLDNVFRYIEYPLPESD